MTTAARAGADVGLIGLAVMGQNLALNIADHAYRVAVYNRTTAVMEKFVAGHADTPGGLVGTAALPEFVGALKKPRKILILVKAGPPVDAVVEQLLGAGVGVGIDVLPAVHRFGRGRQERATLRERPRGLAEHGGHCGREHALAGVGRFPALVQRLDGARRTLSDPAQRQIADFYVVHRIP